MKHLFVSIVIRREESTMHVSVQPHLLTQEDADHYPYRLAALLQGIDEGSAKIVQIPDEFVWDYLKAFLFNKIFFWRR